MATPVAPRPPLPVSAGDGDLLIEQARAVVGKHLRGRDRLASLVLAGGFAAAAAALAVLGHAHRQFDPWTVGVLVVSYAASSRIEFEIGTGSTVPTQLVLVPMLALVPAQNVPLCVLAGLLLGSLPEYVRGRVAADRSVLRFVNSWHAVGPALVLLVAGQPPPTPRHLWIYALALAAQFGFDFASTALRDRLGLGVTPLRLLPVMAWIWAVDSALTPIAIVLALGCRTDPWLITFALPLVALLAHFAREREMRIDHALELSAAYRGTALLLGDVVEADDEYTGLHSRDVVALVIDVCDRLGVTGAERRDAEFAALLHDIGKIRIPGEIINKRGRLTDAEFELIKTHTIEGEQLLAQVGGLLGNVGRIVRSCHENWDGSGYPDGLAHEQIPLVARIVRCCDAFSAMTTDRSYRRALPAAEALAELHRCSGTHFDPAVVRALAALVDQRPR
jgi:HD-GYP domain-containing protein (c-di-GMP phosphodiesterase class II)